jgi:hypothetical protein
LTLRKDPLLEGHALGRELFFGLADGGDLRMREHDGGHQVVVDVDPAAGHAVRTGHAVFLGLVGEHRPGDAVADRPHARSRGAKLSVHRNEAPPVGLEPDGLEAQVVGGRAAAGGGEHPVAPNRLGSLDLDDAAGPLGPRTGHLDAQPDVEPLLAKQRERLGGDVAVDAEQDPVGILEHRHP